MGVVGSGRESRALESQKSIIGQDEKTVRAGSSSTDRAGGEGGGYEVKK